LWVGNIAIAPKDTVRFYHALARGKLVSADSLAQMTHWEKLTKGYSPPVGTPYGLGLLSSGEGFGIIVPKEDVDKCLPPLCACYKDPHDQHAQCQYYFNASGWGHPGLDWASGMPEAGWIPDLNLSYSLAFNSFGGLCRDYGSELVH
jgi:hypothetical protein